MTPTLHPALAGARAPSMLRIHLLEAWYEFLRTARTPAFAVPTTAAVRAAAPIRPGPRRIISC